MSEQVEREESLGRFGPPQRSADLRNFVERYLDVRGSSGSNG